MKPADKALIKVIVLQVGYLILGLLVAVIVFVLEGVAGIRGDLLGFQLSGSVAAVVFVFWLLYKTGPHKKLLEEYDEFGKLSQKVSADVIQYPHPKEDYDRLLDGFKHCEYLAYNPPFKMEQRTERVLENALDVHLERYMNGVTARYLFYNKDSFEEAIDFFEELRKRALEKGILLAQKIQLLYQGVEKPPSYTYLLGKRSGAARCILYPSATFHEGLPEVVIVVEGDSYLLRILTEHFDKDWQRIQDMPGHNHWIPKEK